MKIHIAILVVFPVLAYAQLPSGPVHDLSKLPTLQGTQDALRGYITKDNESKRGLPFSLTVEGMNHRLVNFQLSLTKTNELSQFTDICLQSQENVLHSLWVPIAPIQQSDTTALFSLRLPLDVAQNSLLILACGKDEQRALPSQSPELFVKMLYAKCYTIRLGSYVPMISFTPDPPPTKQDMKVPEDPIAIDITL